MIDVRGQDIERRPCQLRSRVEIRAGQSRDGKRDQIEKRRHGRGDADVVHEDLDIRRNDHGAQRNHPASGGSVEGEIQERPEFGPPGIDAVQNVPRDIGLRDGERAGSGEPDVSIDRLVAQGPDDDRVVIVPSPAAGKDQRKDAHEPKDPDFPHRRSSRVRRFPAHDYFTLPGGKEFTCCAGCPPPPLSASLL